MNLFFIIKMRTEKHFKIQRNPVGCNGGKHYTKFVEHKQLVWYFNKYSYNIIQHRIVDKRIFGSPHYFSLYQICYTSFSLFVAYMIHYIFLICSIYHTPSFTWFVPYWHIVFSKLVAYIIHSFISGVCMRIEVFTHHHCRIKPFYLTLTGREILVIPNYNLNNYI